MENHSICVPSHDELFRRLGCDLPPAHNSMIAHDEAVI